MLGANMRLDLGGNGRGEPSIVRLEPEALGRAPAWRDGMLAFEGETLAAATAKFSRYAPVRFTITDPALAREPVTGLFAANDLKGFARAVAPSLNARAEIGDSCVLLSRGATQK